MSQSYLDTPPAKEFEKRIRSLAQRGGHRLWKVFDDFVECAALSLSQMPCPKEDREKRYLEVIGKYSKEEAAIFGELLGLTRLGVGEDFDTDFLGHLFMTLELGDHWKGQFFTPMDIAGLIAQLNIDPEKMRETIEEQGYVTLNDCAVGAGALVIAFAGQMKKLGYNPSEHLHAMVIDKDPTAFHMCYVQLALLGIPAEVWLGDTLTMKMQYGYGTPAHWLGAWDLRRENPEKWAEWKRDVDRAEAWRKAFALVTPKPIDQEEPPPAEDEAA